MRTSPNTILVGTSQGIYRVGEDSVVPLSTDLESVPVLLCPPRGSWFAGTGGGQIFRTGEDHVGWAECPLGAATQTPPGAVVALLRIPGTRPRLLALCEGGTLYDGGEDGHRFEPWVELPRSADSSGAPAGRRPVFQGRRASLVLEPGRRSSVLVAHAETGLHRVDLGVPRVERLLDAGTFAPHSVLPHPSEASVWMVAGRGGLLRSNDAGANFVPVPLEDSQGPIPGGTRDLAVETVPGGRYLLLCDPSAAEPERPDRSCVWISSDLGQRFVPLEPGPIDKPRDPCGEILCIALHARGEDRELLFGTDRGELLRLRRGRKGAELLASDLPPVLTLLRTLAEDEIDPSTSGIHLLP